MRTFVRFALPLLWNSRQSEMIRARGGRTGDRSVYETHRAFSALLRELTSGQSTVVAVEQ